MYQVVVDTDYIDLTSQKLATAKDALQNAAFVAAEMHIPLEDIRILEVATGKKFKVKAKK